MRQRVGSFQWLCKAIGPPKILREAMQEPLKI